MSHFVRLSNAAVSGLLMLFSASLTPVTAIETAETLFVDLDAADPSAGTPTWTNNGTLGDFVEVGDPVVVSDFGPPAVSFNLGATDDAYQSAENAPEGLIGPDPTRSIEVWVLNPSASGEETLLAWGRRGGPAGTNMSFNYGTHGAFGAIGHWGGPDIGWNDAGGAPEAGRWHHLVYTYDGETTTVYADGVEANSETLGAGVINTHAGTRITLAAQLVDAAGGLDFGPREGKLSLGLVRVHDDVLTADQVAGNYELESAAFRPLPEVVQLAADCNQDGSVSIDDVLCYVTAQFPGFVLLGSVTPGCTDPAILNINGDDALDLSDTIYLANFLFSGGPPPAQGTTCFAGQSEECESNPGCQ